MPRLANAFTGRLETALLRWCSSSPAQIVNGPCGCLGATWLEAVLTGERARRGLDHCKHFSTAQRCPKPQSLQSYSREKRSHYCVIANVQSNKDTMHMANATKRELMQDG
jgi:hypothetical protein